MSANQIDLKAVVEASAQQLTRWILTSADVFVTPLAHLYARVRQSALKGELDETWKIPLQFELLTAEEKDWVEKMVVVRQQILLRKPDEYTIIALLEKSSLSQLVLGESQCVAAMALSILLKYEQAKDLYLKSFATLKNAGAASKALVALQNSIAMESQIRPSKRLIPEYTFLVEAAKEAGATVVEGMALTNLSREYHLVGSLEVALPLAEESVQKLKSDKGAQHYYLALLHYAHLLLDLGRMEEYKLIVQELRVTPFLSINEAAKVLNVMQTGQNQNIAAHLLTATWVERYQTALGQGKISFGEMETSLIREILKQPQDKFSLIEKLFACPLDHETLDNRFRNLLARIRKKCPGLITLSKGSYTIGDRQEAERLIGGVRQNA